MKRALKLLLLLPIAIVAIALSVANRHSVTFSLDPFGGDDPALSYSVPLFVLLFVAAAIGITIGGVAAWLRQSKWRRTAREEKAEIQRLKRRSEEDRRSSTSLPLPSDRQPVA